MTQPAQPPLVTNGRVLQALQRVADAALAHLSDEELLSELLLRITEILHTDTAAILLLDDSGTLLHARAAKGIEEEVERGVVIPVGKGFAGRIAAERRAITIEDVDHADILNPILREKGIRSLLGVPLLVEGRVLGVLHVGSLVSRSFTADERDLLQLAADRAALAIQHARLFEQERVARASAERASQQLQALQRVADAALAHLSDEELLRELLLRITEILHTDTAAILLLDDSGTLLHARAAKGIEEEVERGVVIPVGKGFAGRIAAERRAITIEDVDHADILNPILREKGIRSLLGVPLLVEGRVLGVLHVGSLVSRSFTADERDLLQLAADRAALAIERAFCPRAAPGRRGRAAAPAAADLQGIPGLELATRYLPASGESLGGDWYDVFPIGGGRVAIAAGDVVGHGIDAAGAMAQLRTALRAYAFDGHPPGAVVDRVNRLNCDLGPDAMTTLVYVEVDPELEQLELVNAGHPPPLVIQPDGTATYLPLQGSIPLGASELARYRADTHPFPAGASIVLYTDGLVERRGESIEQGLERLQALSTGGGEMEALCARLVDGLVPETRADDIAIIAARFPPPPERLTRHVAGRAAGAGRHPPAAAPLAARAGRDRGRALRHRRGVPGGMRERGRARIRSRPADVRPRRDLRGPTRPDHRAGQRDLAPAAWQRPRARAGDDARADGDRGRQPHRRGHGRRPRANAAGEERMSPLARVIDEHVDTVAVAAIDGEIDSSNVAEIGRRLRETLTNQSMALVVDLARTSYLDSAGINLLFALGAELRKRQQRLHLSSRRRRRSRACSRSPASNPRCRCTTPATQRSRPRRRAPDQVQRPDNDRSQPATSCPRARAIRRSSNRRELSFRGGTTAGAFLSTALTSLRTLGLNTAPGWSCAWESARGRLNPGTGNRPSIRAAGSPCEVPAGGRIVGPTARESKSRRQPNLLRPGAVVDERPAPLPGTGYSPCPSS